MPEFHHLNVAGQTVLIGRIIGNINLFPVISYRIPFIQELCQQRMIVRIHRIVLSGIILTDDGVCTKIQKQSAVLDSKIFCEHLRKTVFLHDLPDYQKCTYAQTTAPGSISF